MASKFSDRLRRRAAPVWRRTFAHPFVRGIGNGTLPPDRFRFYLAQDYVFLVEYCRVLGLAAAKAPDLETMGRFADLLHATLRAEMDLHRAAARRFGLTPAALERTRPAPTCHAYTRHLLHVAATGSLAEVVASLLPCQWGYSEIGRRLQRRGLPRRRPLYAEWIRTYASPEFAALAEWLRGLTDRLARGAGAAERRRMADLFLTSSRYEHAFWEMSYRKERWPVP